MTLCTPAVHAQSPYTVSYSGGQWAENYLDGYVSPPTSVADSGEYTPGGGYDYNTNTSGYGTEGALYPGNPSTYPATETCSGQITATFTWPTNGGPAPTAAVVHQHCYVSLEGDPGSTLSTGLPTSQGSLSFPYGSNGGGGGDYTSDSYTVMSGVGSSFPVYCSPSVSASTSATSGNACNANVAYTADASPITLTVPTATMVGGMQEELTGQPITPMLSYSGPGTASVTWSIDDTSGSSLVGGYIANQSEGMLTTLASFAGPSITVYCDDACPVNITATVTITFPDGTTGRTTVQTTVVSVKPALTNYTFTIAESDNFPQDRNDTSSMYGAAENWTNIQVTDPPGFSQGTACFAQKLQSTSRVDERPQTDGVPYNVKMLVGSGNGVWISIPTPLLDTNFPYPFESNGKGWAVSSPGTGQDYPGVQCAPALDSGDNGMPKWMMSTGEDHFADWVMFNPDPTNGSNIWVSLSTFSWYWSNQATLNSTTSTWQQNLFIADSGSKNVMENVEWPTWDNYVPFVGTGEVQMHL